jgi:hypothetical protein
MPSHLRIDRGFTIGANQTLPWVWNFFGPGPPGPNKGPVIFRAMPKVPGTTAANVLVTYDLAECRGGPSAPEVFYQFKIRNESPIAVPFDLEMILFDDLPIQNFN